MASRSVKRQRKRKRIDSDGDPEFQVAPMVDVLLVLLLFFMAITSTEVLKKDKNLVLADADKAKKMEHAKDKIVINVEWNSVKKTAIFLLEGSNPYSSPDGMTPILGARVHDNPGAFVEIRSDKNVEYSNISDLMAACAKAGITTINFAVISGGVPHPGAAPAPPAATP